MTPTTDRHATSSQVVTLAADVSALRSEVGTSSRQRLLADWARWVLPLLIAAVVGYFSAQSAIAERLTGLEHRTHALEAERAERKQELRDIHAKIDRLLETVLRLHQREGARND